MKKELKAERVLESLQRGSKTAADLERECRMSRRAVAQGIAALRDEGYAVVCEQHKGWFHYSIAEVPVEVTQYQNVRLNVMLAMVTRLGKMADGAVERWPEDYAVRMLHRGITRLREDLAELLVR